MKTLLNVIYRKIKSKTPKIWRDIQKLCGGISVACGSLLAYNQTANILNNTDIYYVNCVIGACIFIIALAQTKEVK